MRCELFPRVGLEAARGLRIGMRHRLEIDVMLNDTRLWLWARSSCMNLDSSDGVCLLIPPSILLAQ